MRRMVSLPVRLGIGGESGEVGAGGRAGEGGGVGHASAGGVGDRP